MIRLPRYSSLEAVEPVRGGEINRVGIGFEGYAPGPVGGLAGFHLDEKRHGFVPLGHALRLLAEHLRWIVG